MGQVANCLCQGILKLNKKYHKNQVKMGIMEKFQQKMDKYKMKRQRMIMEKKFTQY